MKRFINWLKALFNRTMDNLEDPDMMLDQAKRDMNQAYITNKERAVQAIAQKNQLENLLKDERKKAEELERKAGLALKQGNRDLAVQLMREKMNREATIGNLQTSYDQALATVEQIKVGLKRQEEEVRKKTAEALALKAQWKQAQIQTEISKALDGLNFENQFEGFGAVEQRIREKQSEAAARAEVGSTSLSAQLMDLESKSRDYEAEDELSKLEERLGMSTAPKVETPQQVTVSEGGATASAAENKVSVGEAEAALADLEKRLNGN